MDHPFVLILESRPLYAAALAAQLESCGFAVETASQVPLTIGKGTTLMVANINQLPYPNLLKGAVPLLRYRLHDGQQLQLQYQAWRPGSILEFPCSVQVFREAVETTLRMAQPESQSISQALNQPGPWALSLLPLLSLAGESLGNLLTVA